jgi:dihydrofolate synthase/folylpolyglutamate synthase
MGGRLDATNVIKFSLLFIITGIALDHTAFLGDTIAQIAEEKSGIIKHNSKIIFGGEDDASEKVIAQISSNMQSKLYKVDYSGLKINSFDLGGTSFNFGDYRNVRIGMLGSYQPKNACIVLAACDIFNESGISIDEMSIRGGLIKASWPARFEIINDDPLVIFDGAHNPQGIGVAVESIKSYFPDKKVVVLSGVLRDKDYTTIAKSISEIALYVYTITPENPRALTAEKYARIILDNGVNSLPCQSISEAILLAKQKALEENTALICLGSLYTYGEVLSAIKDID